MNGYSGSSNQPCTSPSCGQQRQPLPGMQASQPGAPANYSPFLVPPAAQPGTSAPYIPGTANEYLPITPQTQPMPVTVESLQYINGYLRTQIGKKVTVDFLIGTNTLVDKTGTLLAVGANYIIINEVETDDLLVCDFYNIKFVKIYL